MAIQDLPDCSADFKTKPAPARLQGLDEDQLTKLFNHFVDWTNCVYRWQREVTGAVHELEMAAGKREPNPEDPPPPPWRPKNGP